MLLILLLGTSLGIGIIGCLGKSFEVERYDTGDAFYWSSDTNCADFNGYLCTGINTKDCNTTLGSRLGCCCLFGYTFDTLSGKCDTPGKRYQFRRHELFSTDVSAMQAYCAQNDEQLKDCVLISTTAGIQLPVIFKGNYQEVDSLGSCDIIDVCIRHDCKSRKLSQVTAKLRLNSINGNHYLRLESLPNEIISKLEGELLEVTINCTESGMDKLLFKFAGRVDLHQDKRLLKEFIPHYDPSHYPNSSTCPNKTSIPPSTNPLNTKSSSKNAMIPIIIGPLSVCIVLVLILTGYYYRQKRRARINGVGPRQRLIPEGAERVDAQLQPQPQPPVQATSSTDESVGSSTTRSTSSNMISSRSTVVDLVTSQAPHQV